MADLFNDDNQLSSSYIKIFILPTTFIVPILLIARISFCDDAKCTEMMIDCGSY